MAPAGGNLNATGSFAPNMPDDQPPKVGYVATLFKDGKLVNTLVGALPKETIEQHLISIMKTN